MTYNIIRLNSVDWLFININEPHVEPKALERLSENMKQAGLENVFIFNLPITK